MTDDLFAADQSNTALSPEEQLDLIPSLTTRGELNEAERANIHAARVWAMRPRTLARSELLTDAFAREPHKRMFNQIWRWAARYRKSATKKPPEVFPAAFKMERAKRLELNDLKTRYKVIMLWIRQPPQPPTQQPSHPAKTWPKSSQHGRISRPKFAPQCLR